ncbi:calcium-activated chloride channel regulator 1-like [Asterias amurensis]|uniref:calcium-activated chloride channel regulator 1-like n=1 Tax=Asterias amurensis TaxID=7602 RepID=UPI003AB4C91C
MQNTKSPYLKLVAEKNVVWNIYADCLYINKPANMMRCRAFSITVFFTLFGSVFTMDMPPPRLGNWNRAPVTLINNGYTGLVVAIADSVPEDPKLIDDIKAVFKEASAVLYQATDHRAYIREMTILVPQTWGFSPAYMPGFTESFRTANIVLNTASSTDIPAQPFVKQPGSCGEEGVYLHMTSEVFSGGMEEALGNLSRVIVHEWGHLRWGLYDEYPSGPDDHFYISSTGSVEPTRCSKAVTGDIVKYSRRENEGETNPDATGEIQCDVGGESTGRLPGPKCRFRPHLEQLRGATGSLMYAHFTNEIIGFCHSNPDGDPGSLHNTEAPSRHNILCNGRSAWDVMLTSPDFVNGANLPREGVNTEPQISVKRLFKKRAVFVLDTSSSMNNNSKFERLVSACRYYINTVLPKGTWVSLIQFNSTASVLAPLTEIRFQSSRQSLVDRLPTMARGNASIGAGLLKSLEVLSTNGDSPQGSIIFVLSDGLEDTPPFLNDTINDVTATGAILKAMAYSREVSDNLHLPNDNGGEGFVKSFTDDGTTEEPPRKLEDEEYLDTDKFVTIARREELLLGNATGPSHVYIDSSAGNETVFRFTWEKGEAKALLRGPSGAILQSSEYIMDTDMESKVVEIRIMGKAEPGEWSYGLWNMHNESQTMQVHVYSRQSDPDVPLLRASAIIRQNQVNFTENQRVVIYGDVKQGELPIINATVRALVQLPNTSRVVIVELFDRGTGADTTRDDGIYSANFMDFVGDGVYKVTLQVKNEVMGQAKKVTFPQAISGVMSPNWNNTEEPILIEVDPFMRVTPPSEFTIVSSPSADAMPEDIFPPSRVTDLRVCSVSKARGILALQWTAPGDDLDKGTVAMYDLRRGENISAILSDFYSGHRVSAEDDIYGDLLDPQRGGNRQTVSLRIPTLESVEPGLKLFIVFRIQGIDKMEQKGDPSNIATIMIDYGASVTTPSIDKTTPPSSKTTPSTKIVSPVTKAPADSSNTNKFFETLGRNMLIVICVCVSCMIFSLVVLMFVCTTRIRSMKKDENCPSVSYSKARSARRVSAAWVLEEI